MAANLGEQSTLPPRTRLFAACNKTTKLQTRGGHIEPPIHTKCLRGTKETETKSWGVPENETAMSVTARTSMELTRCSKQREDKKAATLSKSRSRRRDFRLHRRRGDDGEERERGRREREKVGMDFRVIKCGNRHAGQCCHTLTSSSTIFCFLFCFE